jgi:hypothetical protein
MASSHISTISMMDETNNGIIGQTPHTENAEDLHGLGIDRRLAARRKVLTAYQDPARQPGITPHSESEYIMTAT